MTAPNSTVDQNLLPVQAYFDVFGNFQTFIGQGKAFYATANPDQSGLNITNSTINSTTIGAITPSTGVFTNILTTTGQILTQPSGANDIVNLLALQSYAAGISWKQPCAVATLGNITLSGLQTIDGYTTLDGDRVLVKNQGTAANNGIYIASATAWTRSLDADAWQEFVSAITFIEYGTQAGGAWFCTATPGGTLGVTALNWSQFTTSATYTAGTGLTLTGQQFSITNVGTAGTYGSATLIPVITTNAQGQVTSVTTASNPQGTVTSVTGTLPISSSGGATPAISISQASTSTDGYLSSTDWNTFNNKQASGTYVNSVSATAPITSTGGVTPTIAIPVATSSANGYLSSTDWTTFNNKGSGNGTVTSVSALTLGTTGTDLSSTVANGTTSPVITLQVPTASATNRGALSSADWTTFNGKANAFTYTTNYIPYGQGTTTPLQSSALQFNGTTLTTTNDASISGLTVGKGGGSASTNTVVGTSSLQNNTSGTNHVAFGTQALQANTTGAENSAFGLYALLSNTTGSNNVGLGRGALQSNTTASNNTAVGYQAGYSNSTGTENAFLGQGAGYTNITGSFNTLLGTKAGNATNNSSNTLIGAQSGLVNTGAENTALGAFSLVANTSGTANVALGFRALNANTTASNNTAVGYQAGYSQTTGGLITAVGYRAGYSNTGGPIDAFGISALYSNTSGANNVAMGYQSLYSNTSSNSNTAVGYQAGYTNATSSDGHVFMGYQSGYTTNGSGSPCVAIGYQAMYSNTSGAANTAIGRDALRSNITASNNTAVGYQAGYAVTTGALNTLIGQGAGNAGTNNLTTGNYNIGIGNVNFGSATADYQIVIGSPGSIGKGGSTGYISPQGGGMYQGNNSAAWSITSDRRLKKNIVDNTIGLDAINAIQVRNFEYRLPEEITELEPQNAIDIKGVQLGAIAQELKEILPDCVKTESTGVMSVDTTNLTWYLINAVKELKAEIDLLKAK